MGRYIDEDELKAYGNSTTVSDRNDYRTAILAAETQIDIDCQRSFDVASGTPSSLSFRSRSPGLCVLDIRDCVSVTSVTENGALLVENVDYVLEPIAGEQWSGEVRPYDRIVRTSGSWYYDGPIPTVVVVADWGWAAQPLGLKEVAKVAAKAHLDGRNLSLGLAAVVESGGVRQSEALTVRKFIDGYHSIHAVGIA